MKTAGAKRPAVSLGLLSALLLAGCSGPREPTLVRLDGSGDPDPVELVSMEGRRDGDRLPVRVLIHAAGDTIILDLHFRIGVPTRLESGKYRWGTGTRLREGTVRARSVTFLGGQSDDPSVGGVLELISGTGEAGYKLNLPTTPVSPPKAKAPPPLPSH